MPRCYLKKFALSRKKSWFIDACDVSKTPPVFFNSSIDNICIVKDHYTFRNLPGEEKRFLERYYSQTIESDYNEVYDALINPSVTKISENLRFKIISFVIAQFFRTTKFTKTFNEHWEKVLKMGYDMMQHHSTGTKLYFDNNNEGKDTFIDFEGRSLEAVIKDENEDNRERINIQSFFLFRQLTSLRLDDIIAVYKVDSPNKFISSDHPVHIKHPPFDPTNHITMPLDSHHLVAIMPVGDEPMPVNSRGISRIRLRDNAARLRMLTNNLVQVEQCVQHIIGHKDAVDIAMKMHIETSREELHSELTEYLNRLTEIYDNRSQ